MQDKHLSVKNYINQCVGKDYVAFSAHLETIAKWAEEGIIFSGDKAPKVINPEDKDQAIVAMHNMIQEIRTTAEKSGSKGLTWGQVHADLLQAIETDLAREQEAKADSGFKEGLIHPRLNYEGACGKGKNGLQNVTFSLLGTFGIMMKVAHPARGDIKKNKEAILKMEQAIMEGKTIQGTPIDPELQTAFKEMKDKRDSLWPPEVREAVGKNLTGINKTRSAFAPEQVWFDTRTLDPYADSKHSYAQGFGKSYGTGAFLLRMRGFAKSGSEGKKTLKLLEASENDSTFISFESPSHPSWSYKGYEGKGVKSKNSSKSWGVSRGVHQGHPGFKRLEDIAEAYRKATPEESQVKNQAFDVLYPIMKGGEGMAFDMHSLQVTGIYANLLASSLCLTVTQGCKSAKDRAWVFSCMTEAASDILKEVVADSKTSGWDTQNKSQAFVKKMNGPEFALNFAQKYIRPTGRVIGGKNALGANGIKDPAIPLHIAEVLKEQPGYGPQVLGLLKAQSEYDVFNAKYNKESSAKKLAETRSDPKKLAKRNSKRQKLLKKLHDAEEEVVGLDIKDNTAFGKLKNQVTENHKTTTLELDYPALKGPLSHSKAPAKEPEQATFNTPPAPAPLREGGGSMLPSAGSAVVGANMGLAGDVSLTADDKAFIKKYASEIYNIDREPGLGAPIALGETAEMRQERLEEDVLLLKRLGGDTKQFLGVNEGLVSHADRNEVLKRLFVDKFEKVTTDQLQLEGDIDSMNEADGSLSDFIGQNGGLIAHNDRCDAIFCQKVSQKAENKETLRVDGGGDKKKGLEQLKQDVLSARQQNPDFNTEAFINSNTEALKTANERKGVIKGVRVCRSSP